MFTSFINTSKLCVFGQGAGKEGHGITEHQDLRHNSKRSLDEELRSGPSMVMENPGTV